MKTPKQIIDRVVGSKVCKVCGAKIQVEGYTLAQASQLLAEYQVCYGRKEIFGTVLGEVGTVPFHCGRTEFTGPIYEVFMKPHRDWVNPVLEKLRNRS